MRQFSFDIQRFDNIVNSANNTIVTRTENNDTITNSGGSSVTINALGGDDQIFFSAGDINTENAVNAGS